MTKGCSVRDGQVIKLVAYWDADLALADLSLSPEGDAGGPSG